MTHPEIKLCGCLGWVWVQAGVGELDEAAVEAGAGMLGASSRGKRAAAATEEGGGTAGAEAGEKRRARDADMGE